MASKTGSGLLPEGTVTFLLTDVEGSTAMWEAEPEAMAAAIARHYEVLDHAVRAHDGVRPLEQGEGDSVVAAFALPSAALSAARDAQRALGAEGWATTIPLKVRMAVHSGEARLRNERNYFGEAVIRTARLRSLAHGGQVLVSAATRELVGESAGEFDLIDLGVYRLRDLARAEHVYQLAHPTLVAEFPALRSLDRRPSNLPTPMTSFIGRVDDIARVADLLAENHLVTLTGSGGSGKTRLAHRVAAEVGDRHPDGAWWVDLVGVADGALVVAAIGRAVGVPDDPVDPRGGLARRLAAKDLVLVLDNCEHVLEGCADVAAALLAQCPGVVMLATSRTPLDVPGEYVWRLPPLAVPDPSARVDPATVSQFDAVRLFVDRAARAGRDFRLTEANASTVAEICDRLDGVPLAIELAATRARVLTPAQILAGLDDAIGLLARGPRLDSPRHQTIEASISWSHSLLGTRERVLLRRLAIFASPFTLEVAESVAAGAELPAAEVLDALDGLTDHSLVEMDADGAEARYRLLETVRQFAARQLAAAGELETLADRHADVFAARAMELWPLYHSGMGELLERGDAEFGDLVAMLGHLERHRSPEALAEVAVACLPCLHVRHPVEGSAWGERVLARLGDAPNALSGRLHLRLAVVGDARSSRHIDAAAAIAAATGDEEVAAGSELLAAWRRAVIDPTPAARRAVNEAAARLDAAGEDHLSRFGRWGRVALLRTIGRTAEAVEHWPQAEATIVCWRCRSRVWTDAALLALDRGDLAGARAAVERARRHAVAVRGAGYFGDVYATATMVALYAGERWPAAAIEEELAAASGSPMAAGYLYEAARRRTGRRRRPRRRGTGSARGDRRARRGPAPADQRPARAGRRQARGRPP